MSFSSYFLAMCCRSAHMVLMLRTCGAHGKHQLC